MRARFITTTIGRLFGLALFTLAILLCRPIMAGTPPNVTQGELDQLPPYCPHTMGFGYAMSGPNTSPKASYWVAILGSDHWKLHHYCWALVNIRRYENRTLPPQVRKHLLTVAVSDIDWTIKNSTRELVLLPEIYTRLGEVHLLLTDVGAAYDAFLHARQIKPDYWPAYTNWANALIKSGMKADAKKLVEQGLMHAPDSKILQDQFRSLGGDPASIKVAIKPTPSASDPQSLPNANTAPSVTATEEKK